MIVIEHATATRPDGATDAADADLQDVRAVLGGERGAFDRLVVRHQQKAVTTAFRFLGDYQDALDVAQEGLMAAYRSLESFRAESSFRTWLLRIVANQARTLRSRRLARKRRPPRIARPVGPLLDDARGCEPSDMRFAPERLALRLEVKRTIERAISRLDPEAREVIVRRDLEGESYRDIGSALGLPLGTVKSRVHRARLGVREALRSYLQG
ncbi:MAG: sigma-70 family RNA polymerase sigma factor [Planctomycetes bacterium]|nr:sigma-70 family RNA polymerase sigma factor [Planctomycetota bacterium]